MVNGSQCKISGAGGMHMRNGQTTTWQPYTCAGVCACAVSGQPHGSCAHTQSDRNKAIDRVSLLLVTIHFNPSLSGTMSRRRTAAGPPPLPTDVSDYTSVPRALLALHLDYEHLSHAGTQADRAARLWEHHHPDRDQSPDQSPDPPSSEDN